MGASESRFIAPNHGAIVSRRPGRIGKRVRDAVDIYRLDGLGCGARLNVQPCCVAVYELAGGETLKRLRHGRPAGGGRQRYEYCYGSTP